MAKKKAYLVLNTTISQGDYIAGSSKADAVATVLIHSGRSVKDTVYCDRVKELDGKLDDGGFGVLSANADIASAEGLIVSIGNGKNRLFTTKRAADRLKKLQKTKRVGQPY